MYDNIAKTIKTIALLLFIVGVIVSINMGSNYGRFYIGATIVTVIVGIIISFITSVFIYGFGEIIDILDDIRYNTKRALTESDGNVLHKAVSSIDRDKKERKEKIRSDSNLADTNVIPKSKRCPHCGEVVTSDTCGMCGKKNNLYD